MSNDLTTPGGLVPSHTDLMLPRGGESIDVIRAQLPPYAEAFKIAALCENLTMRGYTIDGQHLPHMVFFCLESLQNASVATRLDQIAKAKQIRQMVMPVALQVEAAIKQFNELIYPDSEQKITLAQASMVVHGLVDAIAGKKRTDADQARLKAMLAMFDPMISDIGEATDLWGKIPQHPVLITLGILRLYYSNLAKQKFVPAPVELADACRYVYRRLGEQSLCLTDLFDRLEKAEEIVFTYDRDSWASMYTTKESLKLAGVIGSRLMLTREWQEAIEKIERQMIDATIRESIGNNGDVVNANVKEGEPVPHGITLQSIPSDLADRLDAPALADCEYFLTAEQIAITEGGKIAEVISRSG